MDRQLAAVVLKSLSSYVQLTEKAGQKWNRRPVPETAISLA
jgi:hypothetical protein